MIALLLSAAALPFAPPIGTPLRYESVELRPNPDGSEQRFTLTEDATFTRDAAGYVLTIRTISNHADALPNARRIFDASMKPFVGMAVSIRVSPDGLPGAVINAEESWAKVLASMNTMAAESANAPPDRAAINARIAAMYAAMPPAVRDDQLRGPATDILGVRIPPLDIGAAVPQAQDMDGPAGPVHAQGTITREADADGAQVYRSTATSDPAPGSTVRVATDRETRLSPSSGLMLADTRRVTMLTADAKVAPTMISETSVRMVFTADKP